MENKNRKILGEVLRDYRVKSELTLKDVANKIGKSYKTVQLYEVGEVSLSVDVLLDLAKVYNVSAGDILNKVK